MANGPRPFGAQIQRAPGSAGRARRRRGREPRRGACRRSRSKILPLDPRAGRDAVGIRFGAPPPPEARTFACGTDALHAGRDAAA